MSYKKFSNLREIFQGDLNAKVMANVESKDFKDKPCNCRAKTDGGCYSGPISDCRTCCIIYQAKCKICNKEYIGNTQQEEKKRMGQHYGDVKDTLQLQVGQFWTSRVRIHLRLLC